MVHPRTGSGRGAGRPMLRVSEGSWARLTRRRTDRGDARVIDGAKGLLGLDAEAPRDFDPALERKTDRVGLLLFR